MTSGRAKPRTTQGTDDSEHRILQQVQQPRPRRIFLPRCSRLRRFTIQASFFIPIQSVYTATLPQSSIYFCRENTITLEYPPYLCQFHFILLFVKRLKDRARSLYLPHMIIDPSPALLLCFDTHLSASRSISAAASHARLTRAPAASRSFNSTNKNVYLTSSLTSCSASRYLLYDCLLSRGTTPLHVHMVG
jgi:hypothetical protein